MAKYVKVEDVIDLINGLDSLPWEEETEELVNGLSVYETENADTVKELLEGKWVDSIKVQEALGMSFTECFFMFEFSRTSEWWSVAGKTEEERARNGQKVTTCFRVKRGE